MQHIIIFFMLQRYGAMSGQIFNYYKKCIRQQYYCALRRENQDGVIPMNEAIACAGKR